MAIGVTIVPIVGDAEGCKQLIERLDFYYAFTEIA